MRNCPQPAPHEYLHFSLNVSKLFRDISQNIADDIFIKIVDIIHRPVLYLKLNSVGLSVPHRKHITSPLCAQQVAAIHRFVTMEY
jgi:hypothetical protein